MPATALVASSATRPARPDPERLGRLSPRL